MVQTPELPPDWEGSLPEYLAFTALIKLGKDPGVDFTYQSPLMGGRMTKGGAIIDFEFINPPDLAVNVQGVYYHYEFGVEQKARDIITRAQMAGQGVTLVFIDEDDIMQDPEYYVKEALNYRDHSRMARG
jgi:hypothetical protein